MINILIFLMLFLNTLSYSYENLQFNWVLFFLNIRLYYILTHLQFLKTIFLKAFLFLQKQAQ